MPLGQALEPRDVTVEGKTRISEGRLGQALGPYEVHGANVAIDMTTTAVEAKGDMLINGGVVAKASWQHVFARPGRQAAAAAHQRRSWTTATATSSGSTSTTWCRATSASR